MEAVLELQQKAESIRNICILAHVDHGTLNLAKVSGSDRLLACFEITLATRPYYMSLIMRVTGVSLELCCM